MLPCSINHALEDISQVDTRFGLERQRQEHALFQENLAKSKFDEACQKELELLFVRELTYGPIPLSPNGHPSLVVFFFRQQK